MNQLIEAALARAQQVRLQAHAPYSKFPVGAVLVADDGQLFAGCNVENQSYGLTICAERAALFTAVAAGARRFQALAIALPDAQPPCGACLQVLAEFCDELPIWIANTDDTNDVRHHQLSELLPVRFRL